MIVVRCGDAVVCVKEYILVVVLCVITVVRCGDGI